jgi:hypothetical protein
MQADNTERSLVYQCSYCGVVIQVARSVKLEGECRWHVRQGLPVQPVDATPCFAKRHVRFALIAAAKADPRQDHVCFTPEFGHAQRAS